MGRKANVIIRDPEILGGIPIFRGLVCLSRTYSTTLKGPLLDEFLEVSLGRTPGSHRGFGAR